MSKHFKDKPDNIVKTYSTAGGIKKEYKWRIHQLKKK
jgi:hypothetical protein